METRLGGYSHASHREAALELKAHISIDIMLIMIKSACRCLAGMMLTMNHVHLVGVSTRTVAK